MKKFMLIVLLGCVILGGKNFEELADDELQPGPFETKPGIEIIG